MEYNFTSDQLDHIHTMLELNGDYGPRDSFRWYHNLQSGTAIHTDDVEDFVMAFTARYNDHAEHS